MPTRYWTYETSRLHRVIKDGVISDPAELLAGR
jgi:hypothetical protein